LKFNKSEERKPISSKGLDNQRGDIEELSLIGCLNHIVTTLIFFLTTFNIH